MSPVVVKSMTATIFLEATALIAAAPSKDARTTEEEEAAGTAETA
jgi:hypothetical protein